MSDNIAVFEDCYAIYNTHCTYTISIYNLHCKYDTLMSSCSVMECEEIKVKREPEEYLVDVINVSILPSLTSNYHKCLKQVLS